MNEEAIEKIISDYELQIKNKLTPFEKVLMKVSLIHGYEFCKHESELKIKYEGEL